MTASIAECEIRTGSSNLSETGSSLNDSESEDESFIELDADSILSYLDDDNLLIDVDNGESYFMSHTCNQDIGCNKIYLQENWN